MRVRDPIHGTIPVSDGEKAVVDSRFFQRLRHIKQLGFGELAFPGATHTRHAHSLGAMHMGSRLFDAVAARSALSAKARERFRAAARLAALCHDIGHMPLSHASERIAPPRGQLGLPSWAAPQGGRATHEDIAARLLLDSSLSKLLRERFEPQGVSPESLVSLITGREGGPSEGFVDGGIDYSPLLRALVSGELDADRMDYLLRDSFFTGVHYGRYDLDWIVQNLSPAVKDGRAYLALSKAAAFAFEDFLLSRYHMFVSVYYHHTSVGFDHMLQRYYEEAPGEFSVPDEPEAFLECDDVALASALRRSANRWAKRIVARDGFKLVAHFTERDAGYDLGSLSAALQAEGIEHFSVESRGVLSKYFEEGKGPALYILDEPLGRLTEVAQYTPLYQRYSGAVRLSRIYARPDQAARAAKLLVRLAGSSPGAPS
ncbi:MAG: HD domain-containing protein [Myxococcales bacterium]|nr:HD domain-containing protein [Myxococcales bacterium]